MNSDKEKYPEHVSCSSLGILRTKSFRVLIYNKCRVLNFSSLTNGLSERELLKQIVKGFTSGFSRTHRYIIAEVETSLSSWKYVNEFKVFEPIKKWDLSCTKTIMLRRV